MAAKRDFERGIRAFEEGRDDPSQTASDWFRVGFAHAGRAKRATDEIERADELEVDLSTLRTENESLRAGVEGLIQGVQKMTDSEPIAPSGIATGHAVIWRDGWRTAMVRVAAILATHPTAESTENKAPGGEGGRDEAGGPGTNRGHGHVWTRPDGIRARCGGQALCLQCQRDLREWGGAYDMAEFTAREALELRSTVSRLEGELAEAKGDRNEARGYCQSARSIINAGVDLMTTDQLGQWGSVRGWLEYVPVYAPTPTEPTAESTEEEAT